MVAGYSLLCCFCRLTQGLIISITIFDELDSCSQNTFVDIVFKFTIAIKNNRSNSFGCLEIIDLSISFNNTHREKLCFTQFGTRMTAWLLSDLFHICLRNRDNQLSSILPLHVLRVQMFEKRDSSSRQ